MTVALVIAVALFALLTFSSTFEFAQLGEGTILPPPKSPVLKLAAFLVVLVVCVYIGNYDGSFHFDDSHSVESNIAVRSLKNIPSFWTDPRTSSFIPENRVYRPLVYTFYSFCWLAGGGSTVPFHFMKMLMHVLVTLSIFLIWRRLFATPGWFPAKSLEIKLPLTSSTLKINSLVASFLLAVAFAVHPAGSECVDYISATTSLQCAMFYLWAYYGYLLYRDSGSRKHLVLTLFLYFLSVASKEEGITLPAMVVVTEVFLLQGSLRERWSGAVKRSLPFWGLGLLLGYWIFAMRPASGNESRGFVDPLHYFITQWRAYLWYMRLWFWPWDLNADSASIVFSQSFSDPLVVQAAIGNLAIIAFSWFNRKRFPALLFGMVWFYVTIAPASSVVVLAEAVNEHRMYLAYVGFIGGTFAVVLALLELANATPQRAKTIGWVYSMILAGLMIGTQERNHVWNNDENLWLDTVEKNPTSGRALNNLALVYLARGEHEKALGYLDKCETYWSSYMYCSLNKAIAYQALGQQAENSGKKEDAAKRYDDAEKALARAYSLNPKNVHLNFHIAKFYEDIRKDYAKASELYRVAIEGTGGRYPAADIRLASTNAKLKRFDDAEAALNRAISVEPDNQLAYFEKARLEFEFGKVEESKLTYLKLLQLNPGHLQAWYNYGVALLQSSQLQLARTAFEQTVKIDPKSEQGWLNLSVVADRMGDRQTSLEAARKLIEINPRPEFQARLKDLQKKFGS